MAYNKADDVYFIPLSPPDNALGAEALAKLTKHLVELLSIEAVGELTMSDIDALVSADAKVIEFRQGVAAMHPASQQLAEYLIGVAVGTVIKHIVLRSVQKTIS